MNRPWVREGRYFPLDGGPVVYFEHLLAPRPTRRKARAGLFSGDLLHLGLTPLSPRAFIYVFVDRLAYRNSPGVGDC